MNWRIFIWLVFLGPLYFIFVYFGTVRLDVLSYYSQLLMCIIATAFASIVFYFLLHHVFEPYLKEHKQEGRG